MKMCTMLLSMNSTSLQPAVHAGGPITYVTCIWLWPKCGALRVRCCVAAAEGGEAHLSSRLTRSGCRSEILQRGQCTRHV